MLFIKLFLGFKYSMMFSNVIEWISDDLYVFLLLITLQKSFELVYDWSY